MSRGNSNVVKCGLTQTTYGEQPDWAFSEKGKAKHYQHNDAVPGVQRTGDWSSNSRSSAPPLKSVTRSSPSAASANLSNGQPRYGAPVDDLRAANSRPSASSSSFSSSSSSSSSSSQPKYGGPVSSSSSSSQPKYGGPVSSSSSSSSSSSWSTSNSAARTGATPRAVSPTRAGRPSVNAVSSGYARSSEQSSFQRDTDASGRSDVVECGLSKTTYEKQPAWAFAEQQKNQSGRYQVGKNTSTAGKSLW
ncbi:hypothetical protein CAOG_05782 [Capsaspora owczarzaki ATCC 30864]|uniref:Uncharacterized protein n=1 Tax=Capsaspora owczarzaki (strain ATCC 30864) TaxID=595528 RepID=A0A0D2VV56_CAPO3|nr:hypothetical protein CAOG_05782 [Capsaspora owczarzaki ATCC 30864]KJE95322.1 hypothetical protein CAOG_005782 [Capsaspora owczarzaki ATCC 30864]|eukprot:XP_004346455.1 hypothetical protein CAOG_05782 [Capsaspora owczarzaki ATCC 30864]